MAGIDQDNAEGEIDICYRRENRHLVRQFRIIRHHAPFSIIVVTISSTIAFDEDKIRENRDKSKSNMTVDTNIKIMHFCR